MRSGCCRADRDPCAGLLARPRRPVARARRGFQLAWAVGMLLFGIGAGGRGDRSVVRLERPAVPGLVSRRGGPDAGLARARDGVPARPDAIRLHLRRPAAVLGPDRPDDPQLADVRGRRSAAAAVPHAAVILALAIATETYFQNDSWTRFAAAVVGSTILAIVLMALTTLPPPGYALDAETGQPTGDLMPGYLRLLTPILNFTGALALLFGAVFSTYVFMPKKRVLPYSLDPNQPGDQFLFNLLIAPVAIVVNLIASLPRPAGRCLPASSTAASRRRSSSPSGRSSRRSPTR